MADEIKHQGNGWGGKREGSGRKRMGDDLRVTLGGRVDPAAAAIVGERARREGVSLGVALERIVCEWQAAQAAGEDGNND